MDFDNGNSIVSGVNSWCPCEEKYKPDKGDIVSEIRWAVPWVDVLRLKKAIKNYHGHDCDHGLDDYHHHHHHQRNHHDEKHLYTEVLMREPLILFPHIPLAQANLHPMRLGAETIHMQSFPILITHNTNVAEAQQKC